MSLRVSILHINRNFTNRNFTVRHNPFLFEPTSLYMGTTGFRPIKLHEQSKIKKVVYFSLISMKRHQKTPKLQKNYNLGFGGTS